MATRPVKGNDDHNKATPPDKGWKSPYLLRSAATVVNEEEKVGWQAFKSSHPGDHKKIRGGCFRPQPQRGWGWALKDTLQSPFSGGMGTGKEMKLLQFGLIFRGLFQMSLVNSGCVFLLVGIKGKWGLWKRAGK
ncbi:hypothetical protein CDAR_590561 [Caerostris darwini]|uniref:Uncharacterized protein n=1 Tax=Caerostris darwini TaxID=1538125 RepID=A0AAV4TRM4_9ARAC|nr:hypothetical protein CDAR_590561 [Caerostris darwini]